MKDFVKAIQTRWFGTPDAVVPINQAQSDVANLIAEIKRLDRELGDTQRVLNEYVSLYNIC